MAAIKSHSDLQQSKKLAEILPIESADMCYVSKDDRGIEFFEEPDVIDGTLEDVDIRCWSLAALFGVLPYGYSSILTKSFNGKDYYCKIDGKPFETEADNPVDACYEMIIRLHKLNLL